MFYLNSRNKYRARGGDDMGVGVALESDFRDYYDDEVR